MTKKKENCCTDNCCTTNNNGYLVVDEINDTYEFCNTIDEVQDHIMFLVNENDLDQEDIAVYEIGKEIVFEIETKVNFIN